MLSTYRKVLSLPGALAFSLTGLIARLPISMVSLGIVLLISDRTGSYGYAGAVAAVAVVAGALASPLQGRLADAHGQYLTLCLVPTFFVTAMASLVLSIEFGWPDPVPYVCAALTGAAIPQIGSLVRARWASIVDDRPSLNTAYAFEAVIDEAVFITGPVAVTMLATAVDPIAGLACAGASGLVGGLALAVQRRTAPPVHATSTTQARDPISWAVLLPLCLAAIGSGVMFGSGEVVTVAFATHEGQRGASGILLALWAAASLIAGVIVGASSSEHSPLRRFRMASLALTVTLAPLVVVPSVPLLGLTLFVSGFAISPMLVAETSLIERVVPRTRLTEGMSWFWMGMAGGVALGGAVSGVVIDEFGPSLAFLVTVVGAVVAAAIAWLVPESAARHGTAAESDWTAAT